MKRRTCPCSSRRWVLRAGKLVSISVISSGRLWALDWISFAPSVCFWNAFGNRTLTDTCSSQHYFAVFGECFNVLFKIGKARTDSAFDFVGSGEGVGGLEAVAGDAGDGELIRLDASVSVEAGGDGGRDASGGLGEDAF